MCPTLWDPMNLYSPWNSPGQSTGVGNFPSPEDLPNPGIRATYPALQADSLPAEPQGKPKNTGVGSLSFSGFSRSRIQTWVSCFVGRFFTNELSGKPTSSLFWPISIALLIHLLFSVFFPSAVEFIYWIFISVVSLYGSNSFIWYFILFISLLTLSISLLRTSFKWDSNCSLEHF